MIEQQHRQNQENKSKEDSFDESMAALFVLITHHSLTQCEHSVPNIVERLNQLCHHSEIEHYPSQMSVLIKMQQLWSTRLFRSQLNHRPH